MASGNGYGKDGVVIDADELETGTGKSFGLLYAFKQLADRHHLTQALGKSRQVRVAKRAPA